MKPKLDCIYHFPIDLERNLDIRLVPKQSNKCNCNQNSVQFHKKQNRKMYKGLTLPMVYIRYIRIPMVYKKVYKDPPLSKMAPDSRSFSRDGFCSTSSTSRTSTGSPVVNVCISDSFKSIYRSFHIFNCRQLFRTSGPHQNSALNKNSLKN